MRGLGRITDRVWDLPLHRLRRKSHIEADAAAYPTLKVLLTAVEVPSRKVELRRVLDQFSRTKHELTIAIAPMGARGKYQNINAALEKFDTSQFDWLIVTDDDIVLPEHFTDQFLYISEKIGLDIAQPAHRFHSYASFNLNLRKFGCLARTTHFVETGPVTAFRRDIFPVVLPFNDTRWAWGLDVWWAEMAREKAFPIGIVDATPIEHLRPVANSYDHVAAIDEAKAFLLKQDVVRERSEILRTTQVFHNLPRTMRNR